MPASSLIPFISQTLFPWSHSFLLPSNCRLGHWVQLPPQFWGALNLNCCVGLHIHVAYKYNQPQKNIYMYFIKYCEFLPHVSPQQHSSSSLPWLSVRDCWTGCWARTGSKCGRVFCSWYKGCGILCYTRWHSFAPPSSSLSTLLECWSETPVRVVTALGQ